MQSAVKSTDGQGLVNKSTCSSVLSRLSAITITPDQVNLGLDQINNDCSKDDLHRSRSLQSQVSQAQSTQDADDTSSPESRCQGFNFSSTMATSPEGGAPYSGHVASDKMSSTNPSNTEVFPASTTASSSSSHSNAASDTL